MHAVTDLFETKTLAWLKELVDQPSHTYAKQDVQDAFVVYDRIMAELGMQRELFPSKDTRFADHRLYLNEHASRDNLGTVLVGHIDTVFPRDTGFLKFKREDHLCYGPGVLDMKGGLCVMATGIAATKNNTAKISTPISVLVVSDEEVGSPDCRRIIKQLAPEMKQALVFEGGRKNDDIVVARKGAMNVRVNLTGIASHAGNCYEEGQSAIHAAALLIPYLESQTNMNAGTTVNVGTISGGTAKNVVPEHCEVLIDCRFQSACEKERLDAFFKEVPAWFETAKKASSRTESCRLKVEILSERPVLEPTAQILALADTYLKIQHDVGLSGERAPLQGGGSDANLLASHGVPVIDGLGPHGTGFHSLNEWADLDNMRLKCKALTLFLDGANLLLDGANHGTV